METSLWSAEAWARAEFGAAMLGDARRGKRLVQVAAALVQTPHGRLNRALRAPAEKKAGYRMLEQDGVTPARIRAPHLAKTRAQCQRPGAYLLVEDSTALNFTGLKQTTGLGRIGDDRGSGLLLHTVLALKIERWSGQREPQVTAVGLLAQHTWARTTPSIGMGKELRWKRLKRTRESQRWAAELARQGGPGPGTRWTLVCDREGDIFDVFEICQRTRADWIIRACQPRALQDQSGAVFSAVANAAVLGTYTLALRARPGQRQRTACLEVRSTSVNLRAPHRPGGRKEPLQLRVVEAREMHAPEGREPIRWVLLTSWECGTFEAAQLVVQAYTKRWLIEEYHKALKTGTQAETTQFMTAERIENLLAVLGVVAVRLLDLKLQAEARPAAPIDQENCGAHELAVLEKFSACPKKGWTNLKLLLAVAKLGGFGARKGDGLPGWQSIWHGWQRLTLLAEGYALACPSG